MRFRLSQAFIGFLAAFALAVPAAHAFTVENKDAAGHYTMPKFDLEEQAKGFRKDGTGGTSSNGVYSTPFGSGTLQFGVRQGYTSGFGSAIHPSAGSGLSFGGGSFNSRQEFERRLAPPSSMEYNGLR